MRLGVPYDRAVRRALRTLFPVLVLALAGIAGGAVHAQPPAGDGMAAPPQPAAGDRAGLTTPHELEWHLNTALIRLVLQLWPLTIFLVLAAANVPHAFRRRGA